MYPRKSKNTCSQKLLKPIHYLYTLICPVMYRGVRGSWGKNADWYVGEELRFGTGVISGIIKINKQK